MEKIKTVMLKEWAEVFKNRFVLFTVAFLPIMLTALPLITVGTMDSLAGEEIAGSGTPDEFFGDLCVGLSEADCVQVYMISLFTVIFMILPVMIPVTIASYSIVGEKTTRSLEPLLATPITTTELLIGKAAAAMTPAVVATWLGFGIYTFGVRIMTNEVVYRSMVAPLWLIAIFVVGPLLSLMGVSVAIMVSSRVSDPRIAEQLSSLVILPIILVVLGQSVGFFVIDQELIIIVGVVVAVLDVVLLYLSVQFFQRETILTRWK